MLLHDVQGVWLASTVIRDGYNRTIFARGGTEGGVRASKFFSPHSYMYHMYLILPRALPGHSYPSHLSSVPIWTSEGRLSESGHLRAIQKKLSDRGRDGEGWGIWDTFLFCTRTSLMGMGMGR